MGWYTTYEIEFASQIEWNDVTNDCLNKFNLTCLYLRDLELPRLIVSVYSSHSIEDILDALKTEYKTTMRYRRYDTAVWVIHGYV
jgi:hypothetical protein